KQGDWKYVYYHGMRPQLFNTADDPLEEHDLCNDPAQAKRIKAMEARTLDGWNPEEQRKRNQVINAQLGVIARATRIAHPPEPETIWLDTPPQNYIDPIRNT
ncbi:MAG: hypothetical protein JKX85_13815, partial [Phycisphaeraceae bacterium]|nr:hypothetical protein [Phycisphaeraceae bacterium]